MDNIPEIRLSSVRLLHRIARFQWNRIIIETTIEIGWSNRVWTTMKMWNVGVKEVMKMEVTTTEGRGGKSLSYFNSVSTQFHLCCCCRWCSCCCYNVYLYSHHHFGAHRKDWKQKNVCNNGSSSARFEALIDVSVHLNVSKYLTKQLNARKNTIDRYSGCCLAVACAPFVLFILAICWCWGHALCIRSRCDMS